MSRKRYVAKGVPGGWRIWNNVSQSWWGNLYETQPDELVEELNGLRRAEQLNMLSDKYRRIRR